MNLPVWALVPASGIGTRMGADRPKQYLELEGRSLLARSLDRLLVHPRVEGAVVALAPGDAWWSKLGYRSSKPLLTCEGGAERLHSVLSTLQRLEEHLDSDALVLVHDAVRPFLVQQDLSRLIAAAERDESGALLAAPLADTLKRVHRQEEGGQVDRVGDTIPRDGLWLALTPQAFRLSLLKSALHNALEQGQLVTDDASAMELLGFAPRLLRGDRRNIKLTHPEDLLLGRWILRSLGEESGIENAN